MEVELIAHDLSGVTNDTAASVPRRTSPSVPSPAEIRERALSRLDEEQAIDVVAIDLSGKSEMADTMIVAAGRSQRHVGAMADKLARDFKDAGYKGVSVEGVPACDWVLIDAGDIIVHLFRPEVRSFYNLERIWAPELYTGSAQGPGDAPTEDGGAFAPATDALSTVPGGNG